MAQRRVVMITLVAFVFGQAIPAAHCHAGMTAEQQAQHDAVPHIHLSADAHSHSHGDSGFHTHATAADSSTTPHSAGLIWDSAIAPAHDLGMLILTAAEQTFVPNCVTAITHIGDVSCWDLLPAEVASPASRTGPGDGCPDRHPPGTKTVIALRTLRI